MIQMSLGWTSYGESAGDTSRERERRTKVHAMHKYRESARERIEKPRASSP